MSATARRYDALHAAPIDVPKVKTEEERRRRPLLDRVLIQEHQRHADRLAGIRRVADKLGELDPIVQVAQADGAVIDVEGVYMSFCTYRAMRTAAGRGVPAVMLATRDGLFSESRKPREQNAVANALLAAGWKVVEAIADGSEISRDRIAFMRGRRAVETTCMRQWVYDAIEAGHITADTPGRHPATDTGKSFTTFTAPSGTDAAGAA